MQSGQDQGLAARFKKAGVPRADPIELGFEPYFVYRWRTSGSWHLSAMNKQRGYDELAKRVDRGPPIESLEPYWPLDYGRAAIGQATPSWNRDQAR